MDTNLVLRAASAGDLTADETLTSVRIGPMVRPLWLHIITPTASTADTLDIELEFCTSAAPTVEVYNMNMKQIGAASVHYAIPFYTMLGYLQVKLNVTDGGGGVNYGAVEVWIEPSSRGADAYLT